MDINVITLENGKNYLIIESLNNENNKYLFLVNENDEKDYCVRKVVLNNGKESLVKLDDEDEFDEIMFLFSNKYKETSDEK